MRSTRPRYRISGYDARFIAAATALGTRLVTEDARLRNAAALPEPEGKVCMLKPGDPGFADCEACQ